MCAKKTAIASGEARPFPQRKACYSRVMKFLLTSLVATLFALPTFAADPFTVAKVPVDARADSVIQAQTRAIANGQIAAARLLFNRLTLDSERAIRGLPPLTTEVVGPLIRGLSIDNERRSVTRYLGDISITFNPSAVQTLLRGSGLTMVTSQARERLALPIGVDIEGPLATDLLSGRYAHALTPILVPSEDDMAFLYEEPSNARLRELASRYGVNQVLIIRSQGGGNLEATDLSLDTGARQKLSASDGMAGLVALMEADWKAASAVPSDTAQTSAITVLYDSLEEWQGLQSAINNSAQVRDARLDALSKDGALMRVSYGNLERLTAEMAQKGVRVIDDPALGLVIRH